MTWMLALLVPVCLAYLAWSTARFGALAPGALFVSVNGVAAVSILPALYPVFEADLVHGWILLYSLVTFCFVSFLLEVTLPPLQRSSVKIFKPGVGMITLLVLSAIITIVYFVAVGYSTLWVGIRAQLTGAEANVADLRLDAYAGSRYLFPGYVNQFKNILLPALSIVGLFYWSRPGRRRPFLVLLLVTISAFGILGTGQRGALVLFAATCLTFYALYTGRILTRAGLIVGSIVMGLLMLSTLALARQSAELAAAQGLGNKAFELLSQVFERATSQSAHGTIGGFRYIYSDPSAAFGQNWVQSFLGMLPGHTGSPLPQEIFAYLWGGRGNSPPSIWGSVYYNFGLSGIVVAPVALAFLCYIVNRKRLRSLRDANTLALMGIAGVSVCIGFWNAGSPVVLFNTGIVPYALMWWCANEVDRRHRRRRQWSTASR